MRLEVRNRVTMLGGLVVLEVSGSTRDRRAWLALDVADDGRIRLLEFEHLTSLDTDAYPAPDDILDRRTTLYPTLDGALTDLSQRGVDTTGFDAPWKVDYPL